MQENKQSENKVQLTISQASISLLFLNVKASLLQCNAPSLLIQMLKALSNHNQLPQITRSGIVNPSKNTIVKRENHFEALK